MIENPNQNLLEGIVDTDKWRDFLKRFVEVLWINIFVVDHLRQTIIFPYEDGESARRYGNKFLTTSFDIKFSNKNFNFIERFTPHGEYLEFKDTFDLHLFALPIKIRTEDEEKNVAYMIVGPVILNKKLTNEEYRTLAQQLNLNEGIDELIDSIHEIRVVSFVTIKAILDLLSEVSKDIVELTLEKKKLYQTRFNKAVIPKDIADAVKDLYAAIHLDELLITILDVALNLTQAECGSIMLMDPQKQELAVKVSRGLKQHRINSIHHKIGEGLSGIVAQKKEALIICGTKGANDIQHLLKRPEIKKAAIIPLSSDEKGVFGVLNIHTKRTHDKIEDNLDNLKYVSKLVSAAIHSI